jgi:hypothetical protein
MTSIPRYPQHEEDELSVTLDLQPGILSLTQLDLFVPPTQLFDSNADAQPTDADADDAGANFQGTKFTLHLPDFWPQLLPAHTEERQLQDLSSTMRQKDSREWLTHGLLQEMEMLLPTQDEISVTGDGDRVRNLDAFKTKVGSFFIVGRTFVNYRQFVACGKFLLDAWAVEASHSAKSLYCFYGKPYKRRWTHWVIVVCPSPFYPLGYFRRIAFVTGSYA